MSKCPVNELCDQHGCAVPEHESFREHLGTGSIRIYCSKKRSYVRITTNDLFVENDQ
jgi:hypothetical protein